jgi:biotin synthase
MVGSPCQTIETLHEDLQFIKKLEPHMVGIGPFIPHADTPFAQAPAGSIELTLKLIAIFRLMHPSALIPATTALASLSANGRERGILSGANVVMPNLSPSSVREKYTLYNHKASFGSEAAEGLKLLEEQLNQIGYTISKERGDYNYV